MQNNSPQTNRIHGEKRMISRYAGMLGGRIFLLVLLFFSIPAMKPVSAYLFSFFLLFPWILSNIFASRKYPENRLILETCAKKFYYSPARRHAESLTKNCIIFFLLIWQITINKQNHPVSPFPAVVPGLFLFLYLIFTIFCTIIIRRKIHHYYTDFTLL